MANNYGHGRNTDLRPEMLVMTSEESMKNRLGPWQMNVDLTNLVTRIQYSFTNQDLLYQAMTHTSFAHEQNQGSLSNERLEFLGDAVLDLFVTEKLMELFPNKKEGELSKLRSAIVNEEALFELARYFNIGQCMFFGKGEEKSGGRTKKRNLARVFEALLGALYQDAGFEKSKTIFFKMIEDFEKNIKPLFNEKILKSFDPKTKLQEEVLKRFKNPPRYESRDKGNQEFEVELWIDNSLISSSLGHSKKILEKELAIQALKQKSYLNGEEHASRPTS